MALESGTYIDSLNASNPASTDGLGQADDHLRLIKSTIKATFPNLTGAVTATQTDLNNIPLTLTDLGISDGSNAQVLQTDGAGSFSFITLPPGTTDTNFYVSSGSYSSGTLSLNVTGASNVSVTGFPTATSDLSNDSGFITSQYSPPTAFGAVGTYAFLVKNGTSISSGSTESGSNLISGGVNAMQTLSSSNTVYDANLTQLARGDTTMTVYGSWRAMGSVTYNFGNSDYDYGRGTVFLRIS